MPRIRILLADDHAILRAGLRAMLNAQPDMEVVGEAADGLEAIEKALELNPDVVLMDITMPGTNGLEATRQLMRLNQKAKVLALTMHDDKGYLFQILEAGGAGYVLKKAADVDLLGAIRAIHRGEAFLHPAMAKMLIHNYLGKAKTSEAQDTEHPLTDREREVLKLVAKGFTNQEIAQRLFLSVKTVETHRSHIMEKLQLRNRAELVRYAIKNGLFSPVEPDSN